MIEAYRARGSPAPSAVTVLDVVYDEVAGVRIGGVTYLWAEAHVRSLKERKNKPAPGTLRKRVGALARALDWYFIGEQPKQPKGTPMPVDVLRLLPDGYSLCEDNTVVDVPRDLCLGPGNEEKLQTAMNGVKREDRERPWGNDLAFTMLFDLIVDSGLRLRDGYWSRVSDLGGARGILRVNGTKRHGGAAKPRVVPLNRALREKLMAWCADKRP